MEKKEKKKNGRHATEFLNSFFDACHGANLRRRFSTTAAVVTGTRQLEKVREKEEERC